jgi:hypothetical protein
MGLSQQQETDLAVKLTVFTMMCIFKKELSHAKEYNVNPYLGDLFFILIIIYTD